jgi:hypothetical protein
MVESDSEMEIDTTGSESQGESEQDHDGIYKSIG